MIKPSRSTTTLDNYIPDHAIAIDNFLDSSWCEPNVWMEVILMSHAAPLYYQQENAAQYCYELSGRFDISLAIDYKSLQLGRFMSLWWVTDRGVEIRNDLAYSWDAPLLKLNYIRS